MGAAVYILGSLTSFACAVLLLKGYAQGRKRLLLWSGLCFAVLGASNMLVFLDLAVYPDIDLFRVRLLTTVVAMSMLLYGLIWEDR
jgi:hypothetical protein